MATELNANRTALSRLTAARHRLEAVKARTDMREWQVKRRERTRQLIELGGLVVKAGLVELADDDRATLYGAFLTVAAKLRGEEREQALVLWKRKGKRAFEAEVDAPGIRRKESIAHGTQGEAELVGSDFAGT